MATKFLERLITVYGGPTDSKDINGFFSEYVRALGGYSEEALDLAADKMLRERKYKSWPSIGDCWEYAEQASRSLNSAKDRGSKPPISSRPRERDLEALSDNQIASILKGKGAEWTGRACREG